MINMSNPTTKMNPKLTEPPVSAIVVVGSPQAYSGATRDVEEDIRRRLHTTLRLWKIVAYLSAIVLVLHFAHFARDDIHLSFHAVQCFIGLTGLFGFFVISKENIVMIKVYMILIAIGYIQAACLPLILFRIYGKAPLLDYWCEGSRVDSSVHWTDECRAELAGHLNRKITTTALFIFFLLIVKSLILRRFTHAIALVRAWEKSVTSLKYQFDAENPRPYTSSESIHDSTSLHDSDFVSADNSDNAVKPAATGKEDDGASEDNNQHLESNVVVGIPVGPATSE